MLKMVAPGMFGYRLDIRAEEPVGHFDLDLGRMFWVLGDELEGARWTIPPAERKALLSSIAQAVERAAFYNLRFRDAVRSAATRRRLVGGSITFDMIGPNIYSEAIPLLMLAVSLVEQVVYAAARKAGLAQATSDKLESNLCGVGELKPLSVEFGNWLAETKDYRNALLHRGSRVVGGYYPVDCRMEEAGDPAKNFMLVPDRASVRRPNRPHQWTYAARLRLEHLVDRTVDGLVHFLSAVGSLWGGVIPPRGSVPFDQRPNILVTYPTTAFCFDQSAAYAALFSSEPAASRFHAEALNGNRGAEIVELLRSQLDDAQDGGPGFRFGIPGGTESWNSFPSAFVDVRVVLDPLPTRLSIAEHLAVFPIQQLRNLERSIEIAFIPSSACPGLDRLFIFRKRLNPGDDAT